MYGLRVGADMYESNKLTGAIDELYVYTSALDREAISVLTGRWRRPGGDSRPSTYYFEGTLRAYYSFDEGNATDATGAYSGDTYKNGHARNLGPTESAAGALFGGEVYAVLPDALTYEALTGDEERTICLWARIDDWDGGFLFEYGSDSADGASFGLAVGDAESNVTLALSGSYQTVVTIYGNTSYIDWDDWHHYCLTYDGSASCSTRRPRRGDRPASLDTETMYGLRVGADMYESNKLTGAIDELYVYTSALDREAISVLYGSVTASRRGDTYKNGTREPRPDGEPRRRRFGFDGEVYAVLPDALTYEALTGDEERTICLWARIDDWDGGFLFEYGSDSADGASFGLAVGDAESNVTLALSGSYQTVVTIYGNTSYIDWDDWHHYCLTYDGSDVVLYSTASPRRPPRRLSTRRPCTGFEWAPTCTILPDALTYEALTGDEERTICLWARIDDWDGGFLFEYGSDSADGASFGLAVGDAESNVTLALSGSYQTVVTIYGNTSYIDWDDWHHYCLTYDGSDVVLYFDGLAGDRPASRHGDHGTLRAYYSFDEGNATDATGAYSGDTYKNGRGTSARRSARRGALGFDGEVYAVLPDALTYEALTGDEERTICLWARIDDWDGGFLFEYGSDSADGASFGLAVGDAESNVTLALSGSYQTVVTIYGNTSYIDWDDWHHYCLTYDGSDTMYGLRVGADMYESNKLTGAIDELYVYTSALDREAISVLYGSVTASPTVTPAPSTYYFEGTLRAYYSFDEGNATDATGAYSGDTYKNGHARNLGPTESRDGGDALGFDGEVYAVLPDALTYEALTGDEERTICLWARIDDWDGGFLFEYGSDSADGASFGLAVGDAESNVTLALSGSYQTVVTIYGNTSYIDWDDWHHYCLTYDGSDVVLYFDGLAEATARRLDTETMYGLRVGADMYESNKLTGAIDELYVYTSALDREAISVLYGSTVVTIYGNTSYIDWDDWHHYCLTYDGTTSCSTSTASPKRPPASLTRRMYGLLVGANMYESNKLTGAIDELYVYTSALDREAISVLYGSVTASRR
ncbi:hypothetical protein JL720_5624 [Aureococcus anophagefferens]|nr:hypothetical protein JL720_5624 [Aureococcus anophagefferens]